MPDFLTELGAVLKQQSWLEAVQDWCRSSKTPVDQPKLLRAISRELKASVEAGGQEPALRWLAAGLYLSQRKAYLVADALRPSTLRGRTADASAVLRAAQELVEGTPALAHHTKAVTSWAAFASLFDATRSDEARLHRDLERLAPEIAQDLLGVLEATFIAPEGHHRRHLGTRGFEDLDPEEVAEGVSYALEHLSRAGGLFQSAVAKPLVLDHSGTIAQTRDLVARSYWFRELVQKEVEVFRIGYRCSQQGPDVFRIEAPSFEFGVSLSFGYAATKEIPLLRMHEKYRDAPTLEQAAKTWAATYGRRYFDPRWEDGRYRMGMVLDEKLARGLGHGPLGSMGMYADEALPIEITCNMLNLAFDELLAFRLSPTLTFSTCLTIQRVLRFLAYARLGSAERELVASAERGRALVISCSKKVFRKWLMAFGLPRVEVEEFFRLLCWNSQSGRFLDLQYTPLIESGDRLLIPLMTAADSNIVRNSLWQAEVRPRSDGRDDPLSDGLQTAFAKSGARGWSRVRIRTGSEEWELDFVAAVGGRLFVFECKDTLHPCTAFEFRTTWDAVEKAAEQLDRFTRAFGEAEFRTKLGQRLGIDLEGMALSTGVVLGHWLLSGISAFGHPVRSASELCNYVATGQSRVQVGRSKTTYPKRASGPIRAEDLADYLSEASSFHRTFWQAGLEVPARWDYGSAALETMMYPLVPTLYLVASGLLPTTLQGELDALHPKLRGPLQAHQGGEPLSPEDQDLIRQFFCLQEKVLDALESGTGSASAQAEPE